MKTTRKIKLYVVASKDNLQKVLERCTEGEFQLYAVQGWCNESGLRYFADEVIEKGLDEVLIACNPRLVSSESYEKLITNHIDVHVSTEAIAGIEIGEQYHSKVGSLHTVSFGANEFTPEEVVYRGFKRIFDILCSLVGIILLVPLTIFIKVSYMLSGDFNSIFYTQKRIGLRGEEFNFYKYRSMVPNADEVLMKMLAENPEIAEEYNKNKKLEHDPRITKVGAFLRKTSLDEMPQFINVLKGDMTLIGNRPYLPREKDDMGRYFYDIEETQCGIVSYWAVNGRSELTFDERLKLEQYYSKNRSFAMDVLIFINALFVVLLKKGAQ